MCKLVAHEPQVSQQHAHKKVEQYSVCTRTHTPSERRLLHMVRDFNSHGEGRSLGNVNSKMKAVVFWVGQTQRRILFLQENCE